MRKLRFLLLFLAVLNTAIYFGQGCSQQNVFSKSDHASSSIEKSGNGGTYDGKLRIFHHYVDNFSCEGKPQPESILIREQDSNWYIIKNTSKKCADVDHEQVFNVVYDELSAQATYNGLTYVGPKTYLVLANENPNLPDVRSNDGVCEDINGKCSLRAAVDQAGVVSATEPILVKVPAGHYFLTSPLSVVSPYSNAHNIKISGDDPLGAIIDGSNMTHHVQISFASGSTAALDIHNLSFINGLNNSNFQASALNFDGVGSNSSQLNVVNCIFSSNNGNPVINAGPGNGNINISKSKFINNGNTAIQVFAVTSLLIEDSVISGNNYRGIDINNHTKNIAIKSSTIFNNGAEGISFYTCESCIVENTTVYNNYGSGIRVLNYLTGSQYDVEVKNSTLYANGVSSGSNLDVSYQSAANSLILNNSIVAMNDASKSNCSAGSSTLTHNIVSTNSLFDDVSCSASGTNNIFANPQLGALADNGGFTPTLLPASSSPVLDAGDNATCSTSDQRGFARPIDKLGVGAICDIGAVELQ